MRISERLFGLLHAADLANQWPHLKNINKAINAELAEIEADLEEKPDPGPRPVPAQAFERPGDPIERKV